MTFQYFFFDTYVGDFLQVVPVALLAGVEEQHVYEAGERLLTDAQLYHAMAHAINPYGDGHTSEKIAQIILDWGKARRKLL